jgi:hypothetical protein
MEADPVGQNRMGRRRKGVGMHFAETVYGLKDKSGFEAVFRENV